MIKAILVVALIITVDEAISDDTSSSSKEERVFFPNPEAGPIVNLFQWSYKDIEKECKEYLGIKGFSAVQVSPVTENIQTPEHHWTEKYEPVSYKINSYAGNEADFSDMVLWCGEKNVKIYVEVVINHMTKTYPAGTIGYDKTKADTANSDYPAIPYTKEDFHAPCELTDYNNRLQTLTCEVNGQHDLDQSRHHVRCKIAQLLNRLIFLGAAGFSINAAGHMHPEDLKNIYGLIQDLNPVMGFGFNLRPFIIQDVIDKGSIFTNNYAAMSKQYYVTDYHYGLKLKEIFTGKPSKVLEPLKTAGAEQEKLKDLKHFTSTVNHEQAIVFVDNHLTQRGLAYENEEYLSLSKNPKEYRIATAFMLAYKYGEAIIPSGYTFTDPNEGPPRDSSGALKPVETSYPDPCSNGWSCEHRDRVIGELARFSFLARYEPIDEWWDNGANQIAFARKHKGFLVINLDKTDIINEIFNTTLEVGHYCDVFSGHYTNEGECTGTEIAVDSDGVAKITLKAGDPNGAIFIYSGKFTDAGWYSLSFTLFK